MKYEHIRVDAERIFTDDIARLFNADVLEPIIREAQVESQDNPMLAVLRGHSFKVTAELAPRIHAVCSTVLERLQFTEAVEFFIESSANLNGGAMHRLEDDQPHLIVLTSGLIERCTDQELHFVLGHEIGHLVSRIADLRRIVGFVYPPDAVMTTVLKDKLETWEKLAELTADRFGFLAVPDFDTCLAVFFKLSSGLDAQRIAYDSAAYRASIDDVLEYFRTAGADLPTSHPINPIRLKALEHFSASKLCRELRAGREPGDDADLKKQVEPLVDLILTKGTSPLSEARKQIVATAGFMIASADGEVSPEELENILGTLSNASHFPRHALDAILGGKDPMKVFFEAVKRVLSVNPGERMAIFSYLIDVALSDRRLRQQEVDLLYRLGEDLFGLSRKEAAQMIAAALQKAFVPNLLAE
jgi:uncharacterized tellurite resistance protein B-like protein